MSNIKFSATIPLQYDTPFSPFGAKEFDKALTWLVKSGFDGIEPCISHYNDSDVKQMRKVFDDNGLAVTSISTGQAFGREGLSLTDPDAGVRQKCCDRISQHVDAAAELGCYVTIGLLRGRGYDQDIQAQKDRLSEELKKCAEYARSCAVTLLLEPINRYETTLINSIDDARDLIDQTQTTDCVKILWDLFHANIEDGAEATVIEQNINSIALVHMADSNRAFPGYGKLDFKATYNKLLSSGYTGFMSFECINVPDAQTVIDEAAGFIRMLRS